MLEAFCGNAAPLKSPFLIRSSCCVLWSILKEYKAWQNSGPGKGDDTLTQGDIEPTKTIVNIQPQPCFSHHPNPRLTPHRHTRLRIDLVCITKETQARQQLITKEHWGPLWRMHIQERRVPRKPQGTAEFMDLLRKKSLLWHLNIDSSYSSTKSFRQRHSFPQEKGWWSLWSIMWTVALLTQIYTFGIRQC